MKLNWAALFVVVIGGVLLVVAWEGTHIQVWNAITGKNNTGSSLNTSGAPALGNVPRNAIDPCLGLTGQALITCRKNIIP